MPVVSTNNAANIALGYLNAAVLREQGQVGQLASGSRIIQASDDAAGLAIAGQLDASLGVSTQNKANIGQGSAILQSTDAGLAEISHILQRMMSLASEAASGQVTDSQRSYDIGTEYNQLVSQISTIVAGTSYGGHSLLSGSFLDNVRYLVGTGTNGAITVNFSGVTGSSLGVATSTVGTEAAAERAMTTLSAAINTVGEKLAQIGAYESRFSFSNQVLATNILDLSSAQSVIMDADVASVKAQLSATGVLVQSGVAALAQAGQLPTNLLRMIQPSMTAGNSNGAAAA
jgi:flagellin